MMSIKRYDCTDGGAQFCAGCYTMTEDSLGDYVKFTDHDALAARLASVERERDERTEAFNIVFDRCKSIANERDSLQKRVTECESVMLHYGMETEHSCMCQFNDDTGELAGECAYHEKIRAERDEAVARVTSLESQLSAHDALASVGIDSKAALAEACKDMARRAIGAEAQLDEAVALLREAAPHVGRGPVTKELRRRIDDFLAPDSASHRENERG